jgi:hypothetical protein
MAKLTGPLLSLSASGTIGNVLTFSKRSSGNQTRYQRRNIDRETTAQLSQRAMFKEAAGWWHEMTAAEQANFDDYTKGDD